MIQTFDVCLKIEANAIRLARIGAAALCIGAAAAPGAAQALPAPAITGELPEAPDCGLEIVAPSAGAPACGEISDADPAAERAYLVETATPGFTMVRQGPDVAIGRLHPEFVHRLADAIREARGAGLSGVGIFSAYRPPAFGVGGFSDKFNSLHSYGLAVDMTGIGAAGSAEAKTWYEIAARHGVVCPYGVASRTEWNHCQPTWIKMVRSENPLRVTVTADGPVDLETMFEAGSAMIKGPPDHPDAEDVLGARLTLANAAPDQDERGRGTGHVHAVGRARCRDEARTRAKECAARKASAERRPIHARQSADRGARENDGA
jgi:hypothetical protein